MIVDAHHHLWDPSARSHRWLDDEPVALRRRFDLDDFVAASAPCGVEASILVQVLADLDETVEFLQVAGTAPLIAGVVGWVDLEHPALGDVLAALRHGPGGDRLVGLRHLVQGESDPAWLARPGVVSGLAAVADAGLTYDLLVRPPQLAAAIRAVDAVPHGRFVLDHGGKPAITSGGGDGWWAAVEALAARPNVWCKVSGLVTEAGPTWDAATVGPFVTHLAEVFGINRLIFGSDWPVCTAVASYPQVLGLLESTLMAGLSPQERDRVLGSNALDAYQLRLS
jgi:L-fuconolactonase